MSADPQAVPNDQASPSPRARAPATRDRDMFDAIVRSSVLTDLYRIWWSKCDRRLMPARRDFDPGEMVPLLPHIFMIDVIGSPRRFRCRLIGTEVVNLMGRDATGKFIDDTHYDNAEALGRILDLVCDRRMPVAAKGYAFYNPAKPLVMIEALLMPLAANGADVDIIFAGMVRAPVVHGQPTPIPDLADRIEASSDPVMHVFGNPIIDGAPHQRRVETLDREP